MTSLWIAARLLPRVGENGSVIAPGYDSYGRACQETRDGAGQGGAGEGVRARSLLGDDVDVERDLDLGV